MQVCYKKKVVRIEEIEGAGVKKFILHYKDGESEELHAMRSTTTHRDGQKKTTNLLR